MNRIGLLLLAISITACGVPWVPYQPKEVITNISPDALYAATVRVFVRRGFGLVSRDSVGRVVETEYFRWDELVDGVGVKVSYRVIVSGGRFEVFTSCRMGLGIKPCPGRPQGVDEFERSIITEIKEEANRL